MRRSRVLPLVCLCVALLGLNVQAEVALPKFFSDHMVLQRGESVPVWGTAKAGEKVTVSFRGQKVEATAGEDGAWKVELAALEAGGPDDLTIAGENTVAIKDVLVGEVWFASGQSNMQWAVWSSANKEKEMAEANYPNIREFQVKRTVSTEPKSDVEGQWVVCAPGKPVGSFSAVAYFFARELHKKYNVPVGIIHSSWGGTPAQAWTSMERLKGDANQVHWVNLHDKSLKEYPEKKAAYDKVLAAWKEKVKAAKAEGKQPPRQPRGPMGPGNPHLPSGLYNAMVAPFLGYRIKGAIWYQGESNAHAHENYRTLFPLMITDWRTRWGQGDFPFLFVQLANFMDRKAEPTDDPWPHLREAQRETLKLPNTGMAVIIDIGEAKDIHPRNKQDVGKRLALAARAIAYGEKDLVFAGPLFKEAAFDGGKAVVSFDHVGGGLVVKNPEGGEGEGAAELKGFSLAGEDKVWHWAKATIDGEKVIVESEKVPAPVAVRYGWANNPEVNLYNKEGLPASPFRSDRWARGAK